MTSPARKPRQTGLQTWLERRVEERWVRNYDRQHELSRDPVLRVMVKPDRRHALPKGVDVSEFNLRAIIREEIAADRVLFGGVWPVDPDAAIYMAVRERRIKDERLAPILEALLDGNATALKYETQHARTEG